MAITIAADEHGVFTVTLLGSGDENYLDSAALIELSDKITRLHHDNSVRALILTGTDRMFCSGRVGKKGLTRASDVAADLDIILKVNAAFQALTVPTILAVEGAAFGWAFGMSAQADCVIAAENAVFALPEMSHGMPPLIVLSYLFRFVPYKRAFELALTSREITAREAAEAGIITEIVAPGQTLERARQIARFVADQDPKSVALLRTFARQAAEVGNPALSDYAVSLMSVLLAERAQP